MLGAAALRDADDDSTGVIGIQDNGAAAGADPPILRKALNACRDSMGKEHTGTCGGMVLSHLHPDVSVFVAFHTGGDEFHPL